MFDGAALRDGWRVAETPPVYGPARPLRLLERVRVALRTRHMSRRTEEAYVFWVRRFVVFQGKRHPAEMGAAQVNAVPFGSCSGGPRNSARSRRPESRSALGPIRGMS